MTDTPLSRDDEIVSAVVDGEATADERARVESDPELQLRVAEFRRISEAVSEPVPALDEVNSRRLIDRALAAAFESTAESGPEPSAAPVAATASTRAQTVWWRRGAGIGSAAAVVLLAVLVGPTVWQGLGSDDSETADTAARAATSAEAFLLGELPYAAEQAGGATMEFGPLDAADGAPPDAADDGAAFVWLGAYGDPESLSFAVRDQVLNSVSPDAREGYSGGVVGGEGSQFEAVLGDCPTGRIVDQLDADDRVVVSGRAFVDDHELAVFGVARSSGVVTIIGVDLDTCDVVPLD